MLSVSNQVISRDYTGEIWIYLTLNSVTLRNYRVKRGENIASIIFVKLFDGKAMYQDGVPVKIRQDADDMSFRGEPIILPMFGGGQISAN